MSFWAYVLRCADGSYYTGHSDDLERRFAQHQLGEIAGYTQRRRPVELMWSQDFSTREDALRAVLQIKDWSRVKKEALFQGDWARLSEAARPPQRRSRHDVSASSTSARTERLGGGHSSVHVEPASSEAETRRRDRANPIIILVRPQLGQNIGKAARAMLNFGLTEMRLVSPRDGWPNPDAGPPASGADGVLANATVFATTAEAIADCRTVFASTVRRRDLVMPVVGPEQMAAEIHAASGRTAILFGPERSGLASEDVALAGKIVTVPINPEFGSLNLAQAVILLAYEWSKGAPLAQPTVKEVEPTAPMGEVEGLIAQLDAALVEAGYFHPPERAIQTRATIRTIMTKPAWSSREVKAVRGILRALGEAPRTPRTPR